MHVNKIIFIILSLIILIPFSSYALEVELKPAEIIPGDVFLVKVTTDSEDIPEARFSESSITLHRTEDNAFLALIPVDVDTRPAKYPVHVSVGKEKHSVEISVRSHKFKTVKLTLPEEKVTLSPENEKRAVTEAELLNRIWPQTTMKGWNGRFVSPTDTDVSEVFGVVRIMNEKKRSVHKGMDFRGNAATPVKSINSGKVILTEDLFFGGNTLIVDHGMGLYSVYMHLSKFNSKNGDRVSKDQVIGFIGSTGRATGPHLHMSVKLNGISVNPESLFKLEL